MIHGIKLKEPELELEPVQLTQDQERLAEKAMAEAIARKQKEASGVR